MQLQYRKLTKHLTVVYQGTRGTSTFSVDFHISANLEKYICRLWKMFHCFYFHTVFLSIIIYEWLARGKSCSWWNEVSGLRSPLLAFCITMLLQI